MSDKPEMSADIEAELRELSESAKYAKYSEYQPTVYGKPIALYFAELADRIKAVVKQELCNGAAMREALSTAIILLKVCEWPDDAPMQDIAEVMDKIEKAFFAPSRNCDRFGGDYKMLHTAWFDWTGSPSGQNADGTVKLTFAEWLLAPATEKEGGEK